MLQTRDQIRGVILTIRVPIAGDDIIRLGDTMSW
jgi:hypothetical protein